jgi:hypothetical protein
MPNFRKNFSVIKVARQTLKIGKPPQLDFNYLSEWMFEILRSRKHYSNLRGRWKGQTVFCLGNGPSLNMMDLSLLNGKNVIGTNKAYKLLGKFTPECFDLVIQDSGRLKEIQDELLLQQLPNGVIWLSSHDEFKQHHPFSRASHKAQPFAPVASFWPLPTEVWYDEKTHRFYSRLQPPTIGFSSNIWEGLFLGYSVIFSAIQLAYIGGAKNIVCLGIDMDYVSKGASFDPKSKLIWLDFSYETHCLEMMCHFRDFLLAKNIKLWNATIGGRVHELPRILLKDSCCL